MTRNITSTVNKISRTSVGGPTNYESNENDYIHQYLEEQFPELDSSLQFNLNNKSLSDCMKDLEKWMEEREKVNPKLYHHHTRTILDKFRSQLNLTNQKEIAALLMTIKDDNRPEIRAVIRLIDFELRWLIKSYIGTGLMDVDLSLYLCNAFYKCNMKSNYVSILTDYLSQTPRSLNDKQLINCLFLVILSRKPSDIFTIYNDQIRHIVKNASIHQLSIINMAYFKTKTKIRDLSLLKDIIDRTIELIPYIDVSQPGFCSILKCVRYSRNLGCRQNVVKLLDTIFVQPNNNIIFTGNHYNTVHILKLMETYRVYNQDILGLVFKYLVENFESMRIKDVQYILTSLSNLSFNNLILDEDDIIKLKKLCHDIANDKRFDVHKQQYHLLPLTRALAHFNVYDENLISYLDKSLANSIFREIQENSLDFSRNLLMIDTAYKVEANITEPFPKNRSFLRKISKSIDRIGNLCGKVTKEHSLQSLKMIIDPNYHLEISVKLAKIAKQLAEELSYSHNLFFQNLLAHQNYSELVVSKKGQESPSNFDPVTLSPKVVSDPHGYCILLAMRNSDLADGSERIIGFKQFLKRLYTKLGYTVINLNLDSVLVPDLIAQIQES